MVTAHYKSIRRKLGGVMEDLNVVTCADVFDENDSIDFEIIECEFIKATTNIMGLPGGSIMEGAFFVYKF
ncbi:Uncharacterised protein [Klebsiella variicola]|nr:Uncharacterised protein [Klebsiella variicola]